MKRRRFLRVAGGATAAGLLFPRRILAGEPGRETRLVILHTNDTHSRIDPFPMDGGRNAGLGGVARRATLVERIRAREPNVLLLDSGDIFQGTPYFNFFGGEIEFQAMSAMSYDVATLGNHDFDNGVEGLAAMMPHADFQFVSANYDVAGSSLEPFVRPYVIRDVGGIKVGIFGLGIAFEGLVLATLHQGVRHRDPFQAAHRMVEELRSRGCELVICLSHLGHRYRDERPSETLLAQRVPGIDLILGGHSHTFLDEPEVFEHPGHGRTLVNQVGWAGLRLGRIDVVMGAGEARENGGLPKAAGRAEPQPPVAPSRLRPRAWAWTSYGIDPSLD